jgi:hypothetical protein
MNNQGQSDTKSLISGMVKMRARYLRAADALAVAIENLTFTPLENEKERKPTPGELETAELVQRAGKPVDKHWLAKETGIGPTPAHLRLSRACRVGLIRRVDRGLYTK